MRDERFFLVCQLWAGLMANPRFNMKMEDQPKTIQDVRELADDILKDLASDKAVAAPLMPAGGIRVGNRKQMRFDEEEETGGVPDPPS